MTIIKLAILGSRGIPACYSGYDTLVEELSHGLTKTGKFDVLVYCRSSYYKDKPKYLHGIRLIYLPAPRLKAFESLFHSFLSTIHVLCENVDIIYFVDPANAPFALILRLFRKNVVIHTNGLGWKRRKWGPIAQRYYKFTEWLCVRAAHALVTDNPAMEKYYRDEYDTDSFYISYGAESRYGSDESVYRQYGLGPSCYMLVVARLEPENNTALIVEEYVKSCVQMPLVIVGDSPYDKSYLALLHALANKNVFFTGRINDQAKLNALYKGAYLYIHGHEVGGTNPSLLRAMQAETAPVVIDVPFNSSVIEESGFSFRREPGVLAILLERLMLRPDQVREIGKKARARVERYFTWGRVVRDHAFLFQKVTVDKSKKY